MALAQTPTGNRRLLTRDEREIFEKWRGAVVKGRSSVEAMIAGAACCAYADEFRKEYAPHLEAPMTVERANRVINIVGRWNRLEEILAGCERERFGIRIDRGDVMVYAATDDKEPGPGVDATGLGIIWFVVAGVVLIVGAIITTEALDYSARKEEIGLKKQFADINAKMAKEPPDVRAAWETFQKSAPFAQEKSLWDKLTGGASNALSMLAIGALVLFGFKAFSAARSSSSGRIQNPCGRGLSPKRGGWSKSGRVRWADDGTKRARQIRHIEDHYYGGPQWSEDTEDEVPF
jgi:hypothetical protein